jgi:hypothetical protein
MDSKVGFRKTTDKEYPNIYRSEIKMLWVKKYWLLLFFSVVEHEDFTDH